MKNKWQAILIVFLGLWIVAISIYGYLEFKDVITSESSFSHRLQWLEEIIGKLGITILFVVIGVFMIIYGARKIISK